MGGLAPQFELVAEKISFVGQSAPGSGAAFECLAIFLADAAFNRSVPDAR